jgi:hypothetical protein
MRLTVDADGLRAASALPVTRALWLELLALTALAAIGSALITWSDGEWAWSWDALNHHIYLGLIAQSPRWHLDALAASVQGYQYPYLYWPVYWLSTLPIHGVVAGAIWAAFQAAMLLPPVWLASLYLLPQHGGAAQALFERTSACVLAFSSIVVLAGLGTTANDPMAAVPLLWAMAVVATPDRVSDRRVALAAALWGVSTAFKWSHGLALPLMLLWWWNGRRSPWDWPRAVRMAVAAMLGFGFAYLPWGWQLWRQTGNPTYPFFATVFGA